MSEPQVGMMVTPAVRLVRPLGAGGMGSVWVADHLALHTHVVVKFIAEDLAKSPEALARFSREAAAAAQVKSPHVVQTFDHGVTDAGRPYIVMELLEGRDLAAHLEVSGPMPLAEIADVITQLARGLDRAHARGIVHRDIKPENIFLCDAGNGEVFVKLLDFGIAKGVAALALDTGTKTGSAIGTPYYMSPEQLLGAKDIDFRADLWSVGVVTFEAITGTKPFDADTIGGIAVKAHSEPHPKPSKYRPDLPAAVDVWFARACAKAPSERFGSAKEMADALAAAVTGRAPAPVVSASLPSPRALPASLPVPNAVPAEATARTVLESRAATDAGVVRSRGGTASGRGRLLVVAGALAVVVLAGFTVPRLLKGQGHAPISAVPSDGTSAVPAISVSAAANVAATSTAAATASAPTPSAGPSAVTTAVTIPPVAAASGKPLGQGRHPAGRTPRTADPAATGAASGATAAIATPATSPPPAPPPATAPTASAHDIF